MMEQATWQVQSLGLPLKSRPKNQGAIFIHCYGYSLQLAVGEAVNGNKNLKETLDTTSEISNLLKYSPKRDATFRKLKEQLVPTTPGLRTLCQTRWTVCAASLQIVVDNRKVLQELWEECLATKLKPDIKGCVIGV